MLRARKLASAALTVSLVTAGGIGTTVLSAGAAHAGTCPTASQIVTDITAIASAAGGLNARSDALTPSSSPGDVQSAAQSTAADLNTMVNDFSADTTALGGCPAPLSSADPQTVTAAFRGLTSVSQHMLSILTGKHPIFAQYGVTGPDRKLAAESRSRPRFLHLRAHRGRPPAGRHHKRQRQRRQHPGQCHHPLWPALHPQRPVPDHNAGLRRGLS